MRAENKNTDILQNSTLKENPFTVPQGYFAQLEKSVMEKIETTETPQKAPVSNIFSILRPAIGLAACFALIFGLGYGVLYITNTDDYVNPQTNVTADNLQDQEEEDGEFAQIIAFIGNITPETISETENITIDETHNHINGEQVEEYLINSGVSTTTLASLE